MVPRPNRLVYVVVGGLLVATLALAVLSAVAAMWTTTAGAIVTLAMLGALLGLLDEAGRRRGG